MITTPHKQPGTDDAPRPGGSRLRRRFAVLTAALVTALSVLLLTPSAANAYYTSVNAGYTGTVTFGHTGQAIRSLPGFQFAVPVLLVSRNGVVNADWQQELTAIFQLQLWNGSGWTVVDEFTQTGAIGLGADSVQSVGGMVLEPAIPQAGYYRVVTTIGWGAIAGAYPTGLTTGVLEFMPDAAGEMSCADNAGWCHDYTAPYGALYVMG
jgi:hypothetical protein